MRGKNILYLTIVAILIGSMGMLPTGKSQTTVPRIYIDPAKVPGGSAWGHVNDTYSMSVKIENVENLWAAGFKIEFAPYVSVVKLTNFFEGGFLSEDGFYQANLAYTLDLFHGTVYAAITRIPTGDIYGVSGNGTLMTFTVTVMEAGQSPLNLIETSLLDPTGAPIAHTATGSSYNGVYAKIFFLWTGGRKFYVNQTINFMVWVYNPSDTDLTVKVRYDITRDEDGRLIVIRSGQEYYGWGVGETPPTRIEYLYANGYTDTYGAGYGWNTVGTSPYVDAVGDGNYVWTDMADPGPIGFPITGKYDFQNTSSFSAPIDLNKESIGKVEIEGYTYYAAGLDEGNDLDTYMRFPDVAPYPATVWVGSLWGTDAWDWHTVRWTTDPVSTYFPITLTEAGLDAARIRYIMYWTADNVAHGRVDVDALRLKVSIPAKWANPLVAPEYIVPAHHFMQLGNIVWTATTDHIGTYHGTANIEYTQVGTHWNSWGSKQKTFSFAILGQKPHHHWPWWPWWPWWH